MEAGQEISRLKAQLEEFRQRELDSLREQLAAARHDAAHFRAEAERNANVGRRIAEQAREQIASLQAKLDAMTQLDTHARRFGPPQR